MGEKKSGTCRDTRAGQRDCLFASAVFGLLREWIDGLITALYGNERFVERLQDFGRAGDIVVIAAARFAERTDRAARALWQALAGRDRAGSTDAFRLLERRLAGRFRPRFAHRSLCSRPHPSKPKRENGRSRTDEWTLRREGT